MGTNPSPLTTLQLTSPLPSPSATPGRPVIGADDQALSSHSGNNNNDPNLTTMEGGAGGGGVGNNNNNNKRNTICLQLPPVVSTNIDNDKFVQSHPNHKNHRSSLPPLVFNPPLTHGDALYPLANMPTPSMLRQLPFTMPGARGIFEEIDSSDGQIAVHVTGDIGQAVNQSPRKRPVSWFSKEEDWETNLRSSKRTETSVRTLGPRTKQDEENEEDKQHGHHYHHNHPLQMDISNNLNNNKNDDENDFQVPGNEQLFASSSSNMFPSNIQSPLLRTNDNTISTDTPTSPAVVTASTSYAIDNPEESPNSALPSPSLSPLSSGPQDIVWSQIDDDTNNSPEMIPLDKQQSPQPQQLNLSTTNTITTITTATEEAAVVPNSHHHDHQQNSSTLSTFSSPTSLATHMFDTYAQLPQNIQNYFLVHLLRRSPMSSLRLSNSAILQALRMDIIARLPTFLAHRILRFVDFTTLCRATTVSKTWHKLIDNNLGLWQEKFTEAGYVVTPDEAVKFFPTIATTSTNSSYNNEASAYKELYRRHYRMRLNWKYNRSKRLQLTGHPNNVVTCLQFDDDKIITGSDDRSVNIYDIKTGQLRRVLNGHEGGVWALQYVGNTLVTGSTDRTIRVWDIDTGRCRHVFGGHMSTVRCLTIVMPTRTRSGHMEPQRPMLVSGSRDTTLQVWMLPTYDQNEPQHQRRIRHSSVMPLHHTKSYPLEPMTADSDDPMVTEWNDISNSSSGPSTSSSSGDYPGAPYHVHTLTGHTMSVRDLAAHGNILASGSYDNTVRLWHLEMGQLRHVLVGHEQKVYSVVIDAKRNRCISGSMDSTVRIWSIVDGSCLHVLGGHTILVGLLGLTDNYLVSAAADQTLRVWSPDDGERQHVLIGHQGAITSFQHDEHKVVSGSEGGLKMWDIKTGKLQHDLIKNVSGVWRVAFDERRCVAAVKCADNITRLEVLDYGVDGLE